MKINPTAIPAAPPLLPGAALLFWGWQTGFFTSAVIMTVLLEARHMAGYRFSVRDKDLNQVSDLTAAVFFVAVIFIFNEDGSRGIFTILSVTPFVIYLLVLLQVYSTSGRIKYSVLFMSMRRMERAHPDEDIPSIDLTYPYFIICLVSASTGTRHEYLYFIITCVFVALMLLSFRPGRYNPLLWVCLFVLAISLSYASQAGIHKLRSVFRANMMQLFEQFVWRYRDPNRTSTAIGSIGRFKLSDRIVLRAKTPVPLKKRLYLREATYNMYGHGLWSSNKTVFKPVPELDLSNIWQLHDRPANHSATISTYFIRETGVIPIPHATERIRDVAAININRTGLNTVNMDIYDGWVKFGVDYTQGSIFDAPPENVDLYIAKQYRQMLQDLVLELGLQELPQQQVLSRIEDWFTSNFSYTLEQGYWYPEQDFLQQFLYEHRKGHCEYFATSTVLLLRAAGIPARYAVGFAVDEYSPWENQYIARARDAHSWVLAWVDDRWQLLDTTPGVWASLEEQNASVMEPVWDIWSWLSYRYALWQAKDALKEENRQVLLLLLVPLILYLAFRIYRNRRVTGNVKTNPDQVNIHGSDSPFYRVLALIRKEGFEQKRGETILAWLQRYADLAALPGLQHALSLHYRYRFDPAADPLSIKQALEETCSTVIESLYRRSRV